MENKNFTPYAADYSIQSFVNATWINPHPTKNNTPVANGGFVIDAASGIACLGNPFEITYANGAKQMVQGGRGFVIIPVHLSQQYTIVSSANPALPARVTIPQPLYVRSDNVPANYRVSSAVTFFFVLHADVSNTLVALQMKSHAASMLQRAYEDWMRTVASLGKRLLDVTLDVRSLPVKFGAGNQVMVGKAQKSAIAQPALFAMRKYEQASDLEQDLIPFERFQAIREMASDDLIKQYPISPTARIALSLEKAYMMIDEATSEATNHTTNEFSNAAALPAPKSAVAAANEGDYF